MTTPRLPSLPSLDWKPDGTPVATAMDDVYFSIEDGLAETRAVFLAGCGLPERWTGREQFTVAELGFGTGLNLLALWQMWKDNRPSPTARLDFVSFEGFPMSHMSAARALKKWPELSQFADVLVSNWPVRARGVQHIPLADGVHLTLHIDDISSALPNSQFQADAWFLDGFAPAKNTGMWAPELYPLMRSRSAPGAMIGTYTVAGAVRRGLAQAGFDVSKQPGFGRKRDRLQAIAPETAPDMPDPYALSDLGPPPKTVAIIGAGIAGANAAHAFSACGAKVTLFDKADHIGAGASGNKLALLMPRLDAADTGPARVLLASYLAARASYADLPGAHLVTVHQRPRHAEDEARFTKLLVDPPLSSEFLTAHEDGGLAHHGALIIEPDKLIPALIGDAALRLGTPIEADLQARRINGEAFDLIILANGMDLAGWAQTDWLPLAARLGQVETGEDSAGLTAATASGHYALAHGSLRLWGATFTPSDTAEPTLSNTATTENNTALASLALAGWGNVTQTASRAGIRATTPDKLPFAGPAPDFEACLEIFAKLRHGVAARQNPQAHQGIFLLGGLGARGFTFAPWLAQHLAALAMNTPQTIGRAEAALVSPMRFIYRGLKRGTL